MGGGKFGGWKGRKKRRKRRRKRRIRSGWGRRRKGKKVEDEGKGGI